MIIAVVLLRFIVYSTIDILRSVALQFFQHYSVLHKVTMFMLWWHRYFFQGQSRCNWIVHRSDTHCTRYRTRWQHQRWTAGHWSLPTKWRNWLLQTCHLDPAPKWLATEISILLAPCVDLTAALDTVDHFFLSVSSDYMVSSCSGFDPVCPEDLFRCSIQSFDVDDCFILCSVFQGWLFYVPLILWMLPISTM